MSTLVLGPQDCETLLRHSDLVDVLAEAHRQLSTGGAVQPAPTTMRDPTDAEPDAPAMVAMTTFAPYLGLVGVKLLVDAPRNRDQGRPAQRSTITAYSADTGECLAVVDGRVVTRVRTAAATALATRTLARPDAGVLGLLGAGNLALEHVRALATVRDLRRVLVWSRTRESSERVAAQVNDLGLDAAALPTARDVVEAADVVCTLTPAVAPFVDAAWLRPGTHLNAVGSPPRPSFSEVGPDVFARADVAVVDARAVALAESGNVRRAIEAGALATPLVELGDVLAGTAPGRRSPDDVTVFSSVGIGLQDLATVAHLIGAAAASGRGTSFDLRP